MNSHKLATAVRRIVHEIIFARDSEAGQPGYYAGV